MENCFLQIANKDSKITQDIVFEKLKTLSSERIQDLGLNSLNLNNDELKVVLNDFEYVTNKTRVKLIQITYEDKYSETEFIVKLYEIVYHMKLTSISGFIIFMDEFKQMKPFTNIENVIRSLRFLFDESLNEKVLVLSWNNETKNEHSYCNKFQIGLLEEIMSMKVINCFFFYYYRSSFDVLNRFLIGNKSSGINVDLEKLENKIKLRINEQVNRLLLFRESIHKLGTLEKINKIELKIKFEPESCSRLISESAAAKEEFPIQVNLKSMSDSTDNIKNNKMESFKAYNEYNHSSFHQTITKYEHKTQSKQHFVVKTESKSSNK